MSDEQQGLSFTIDGKEHFLEDFELGELEWLEEELGANVEQAIRDAPMKAVVRVIYLIKVRDNPAFTLEDARKLKLNVLDEPEAEPARPTRAGRKPASSTRARSGASSSKPA